MSPFRISWTAPRSSRSWSFAHFNRPLPGEKKAFISCINCHKCLLLSFPQVLDCEHSTNVWSVVLVWQLLVGQFESFHRWCCSIRRGLSAGAEHLMHKKVACGVGGAPPWDSIPNSRVCVCVVSRVWLQWLTACVMGLLCHPEVSIWGLNKTGAIISRPRS